MIELHDPLAFPPDRRGGVLCIGNFDGLHIGHQRMLATARQAATAAGVPLTVMTFDPHPIALLRPEAAPAPLMTMPQRIENLAALGVDILLLIQTTPAFLAITAEQFLAQIVQRAIGATHIVEGANFTFGHRALGIVATLQAAAPAHGYRVTIVPTAEQSLSDMTLVTVSSSLIRWLIQHGRVRDAAKCLGSPFTLRGVVVKGQQRGRTIGFPTANVAIAQIRPAAGVYAGRAVVDGAAHLAAISVGTNPTFDGTHTTIEAFLLDFEGDLYAKTIDIEFHHWLRDQEKYAGVDPLVRQLKKDVERTREMMAGN